MDTARAAVLFFFALAVTARASTTVYPTGTFPEDVKNVQAALDGGGDVLLKATNEKGAPTAFNFGIPNPTQGHNVHIARDTVFKGESVHGHQTTIQNGFNQVICSQPCKVEISGIRFHDAVGAAIFVQKTAGIKIWGNRITHVTPAFANNMSFGRGIWAFASKPADISGRIEISQNVIDQIEGSASYGVSLSNCDAEVTISQNTVTRVNLNAILVGYTSHSTWITQNHITPGVDTKFKDSIGNGILVGHARGGVFHIIDNVVKCDNTLADGIVVVGNSKAPTADSQILSNEIEMTGSDSSAIGIYGQVSRTVIYGNRIKGAAAYAVQIASVEGQPTDSAEGNTVIGNRLSGFKSKIADIFLDTIAKGTVAKGEGGSIRDKGVDSSVSGFQLKP